ncbi:MAG: hypothetical protein HY687_03930, partial [Chloroflexi bacterium]|nr:hypothetical protein [Chloroflexota bacterium]
HVYDKIQEAYDGGLDESKGIYRQPRKTFFTPDELYALATEFEAAQGRTASENART